MIKRTIIYLCDFRVCFCTGNRIICLNDGFFAPVCGLIIKMKLMSIQLLSPIYTINYSATVFIKFIFFITTTINHVTKR